MWIGSLRLRVKTRNRSGAGTDNLVTATLMRDGNEIGTYALDYPTEDDLERGAVRNYDYIGPTKLPWSNDQTPELPIGSPMPYPPYGIEFSNGIKGHIRFRLEIHGAICGSTLSENKSGPAAGSILATRRRHGQTAESETLKKLVCGTSPTADY